MNLHCDWLAAILANCEAVWLHRGSSSSSHRIYRNHFLFLLYDQGVHLGRLARDCNMRHSVHLVLPDRRPWVFLPTVKVTGVSGVARPWQHTT